MLVLATLLGKLTPMNVAWVLCCNLAALRTVRTSQTLTSESPSIYEPSYVSPWVNSRARRCLEWGIAAIAFLALLPAMIVCGLLVRLSSPGPILFRQSRMGRNGKEFTFYKFRSMTIEASPNDPTITVQGDRRITSVGSFLRRYKLDELPQFWNVLKGDMSLVGPRPKLPRYEPLQMSFRPGITGEATLLFRNEEQMLARVPPHQVGEFYEVFVKPLKAELDLAYMSKATLRSDLRMLWLTAARCVSCSEDAGKEFEEVMARCSPITITSDAKHLHRKAPAGTQAQVKPGPATAVAD